MERFYFLGDSERFFLEKMTHKDNVSLVTGFRLDQFLDQKERILFDLLILDGLYGQGEVQHFLNILEKESSLPPILLITPNPGLYPKEISEHHLVKDVYEGPPLIEELIKRGRRLLDSLAEKEPPEFKGKSSHLGMIGISSAIKNLWTKIEKYAPSREPILIMGENGTGKELVAQAIYKRGHGNGEPFISYQASSSEENLMASDLFGVKKGAFTGSEKRQGLLSLASGGVFFLDEIALLPERNQIALLRVLQEKKIRSLGSDREEALCFRFLSATNENLAQAVNEGRFRRDLYYRIKTLSLTVPSLRERKEDIPLLCSHFISQLDEDRTFTEGALNKLQNYNWPGNIRELRNVVFRAAVESGDNKKMESRHVFFD
jgi:two-component system, NtrC family, nitrogen regulation response regulator NtrX